MTDGEMVMLDAEELAEGGIKAAYEMEADGLAVPAG
jgi:hypothetical protein